MFATYKEGHTTLHPGESATVTFTFKYDDFKGEAEDLHAILDIHFGLSGEEDDGTDYEGIAGVFLGGSGYGLNNNKGGAVYSHVQTNKLAYYGDKMTGGNLDKLEDALTGAHSENLVFVMEYITDTKIILYLYEEKYANQTYAESGEPVLVYRGIMTREGTEGTGYTDWKCSDLVHGTAMIKYLLPPAKNSTYIYAIDITTWQEIVRSP